MENTKKIIWVLFTGIEVSASLIFLALFWFLTLVGLAFGFQSLKAIPLMINPFGKQMSDKAKHVPWFKVIWFVLGGFIIWLELILYGCIYYITYVGIPLGKECFRLAKITAYPFGAKK